MNKSVKTVKESQNYQTFAVLNSLYQNFSFAVSFLDDLLKIVLIFNYYKMLLSDVRIIARIP